MGERFGRKFKGKLDALPQFDGSKSELRDLLVCEGWGIASLVSAALCSDSTEERTAAQCLITDLRALLEAAAAAIDGSDVALSEYDHSLDAADRVADLAHVLAINPPEDCLFTSEALAARELIGQRLAREVAAIRAVDANLRVEKRSQRAEARA